MKNSILIFMLAISYMSLDMYGLTVTVGDTEVSLQCSEYSHEILGDVSFSGMSQIPHNWYFTVEEVSGPLVLDDLDFYIRATPPNNFPDGFVPQGAGFYSNSETDGNVNFWFDISDEDRINGEIRYCRFGYKTWDDWHSPPANFTWVYFQISVEDLSISGTSLVCYSPNSSFTVSGQPSGCTYSWTKSSNLSYVSGSTSSTYTARASSSTVSGDGWAQVKVEKSSCDWYQTKSPWVGPPDPTIIGDNTVNCIFQSMYSMDSESKGWGSYSWSVTDGLVIMGSSTNDKAYIKGTSTGYHWIYLDVTNTCGTGDSEKEVYADCGFRMMTPNPADSHVEITMDDSESTFGAAQSSTVGENSFFRIIDKFGVVKLTQKYSGEKATQINTSKLSPGLYTVQLVTSDNVYSDNLMISR